MAKKIPGVFLFICGVAVSAISKFNPNRDDPFFNIFFYVGIVLIFFGIVKMIFAPPSKRRQTIIEKQKEGKKGTNVIVCPRCNTKNFRYSKYCHMCSYRLRDFIG